MTQYRQRAVQLEADRQSLRGQSRLLARVQDIIDSMQVRKRAIDSEDTAPTSCFPKKPEQKNGLALLPNMSSPPRGGGAAGGANGGLPPEWGSPPFPNGTGEGAEARGEGDEGGGRLSLQVVLKRSRECLEREQSRRGSWGSCRSAPATPGDSLSDKENEDGRSPAPRPPGPADSTDSLYGCTPRSLTGSYAQLPSPEPSLSPRPHRRRPRPVSAGNILISCPVSAAELSPGGSGRGREGGARADGGALVDDVSPEKRSPDGHSPAGSLPSTGSDRNSSHSVPSPVGDPATPVSTSVRSAAEHDSFSPSLLRRSHTLDSPPPPSQSGPPLGQSMEKALHLPGGMPPQSASRRSPPAALNQSYDVESPSPTLQRPHVTSGPSPGHAKHGSPEGQLTPLSAPSREQHRPTEEEVQWQVQALEEVRRRMAEEHAQQLSLLIAEQEREHQRLRQALQEKEWRLREQEGDQAPDWRAQSVSCPSLSPTESSGQNVHSTGFPSVVGPSAPSPAVQPTLSLWGPSWGTGKPPGRANQVVTPELQGALCRLGALARGFLTRRLLKTEKLKHLRQTILDTQEFIRSFQTEAPQKRGSLSAQDNALQDRVRAQLRAALFDVHDIFFVMPTEERLALLQQDRELRAERKLREMEKAKSPRERAILSAATQRSLESKRQR
ncbi:centriolar coiled-coil protein of 110 kDa-like [Megalops cyprinoides]|uniref:centriolar coiled-coil protein of 110 kDa-like n=1 Tax=Megalops cyprinoides TaxID=118141 RepID=UPI001863D49E|nr:centriolar coiled-coil protein of 110 kDa-like [Megalops cyprinoides]